MEYADMLRKTFDLGQKSDYELYTQLNEETAKEAIRNRRKTRRENKRTKKPRHKTLKPTNIFGSIDGPLSNCMHLGTC